jgi:aspartate racemase
MSITEECGKKCNSLGFKKVGILASETSVKEGLHQKELSKFGISLILPDRNKQSEINSIILNILNNKQGIKDKEILLQIISSLKEAGAEAVILGCTDLQIIVPDKESCLPVIDTLLVLEDSVVDILTKNHAQPTENN